MSSPEDLAIRVDDLEAQVRWLRTDRGMGDEMRHRLGLLETTVAQLDERQDATDGHVDQVTDGLAAELTDLGDDVNQLHDRVGSLASTGDRAAAAVTVPAEPAHLDRTRHAGALAILHDLFARRLEAAKWIGFTATETGAWVDWNRLDDSWLAGTEKAALHIARGCALAEQHGGLVPGLGSTVADAVTQACTRETKQ